MDLEVNKVGLVSRVSGEGGYWCSLRWGFLFAGVHIPHAPLSPNNHHHIESSHARTSQNPTHPRYVMWVSGDIREYGVMGMLGYSCMGILYDVDGWD